MASGEYYKYQAEDGSWGITDNPTDPNVEYSLYDMQKLRDYQDKVLGYNLSNSPIPQDMPRDYLSPRLRDETGQRYPLSVEQQDTVKRNQAYLNAPEIPTANEQRALGNNTWSQGVQNNGTPWVSNVPGFQPGLPPPNQRPWEGNFEQGQSPVQPIAQQSVQSVMQGQPGTQRTGLSGPEQMTNAQTGQEAGKPKENEHDKRERFRKNVVKEIGLDPFKFNPHEMALKGVLGAINTPEGEAQYKMLLPFYMTRYQQAKEQMDGALGMYDKEFGYTVLKKDETMFGPGGSKRTGGQVPVIPKEGRGEDSFGNSRFGAIEAKPGERMIIDPGGPKEREFQGLPIPPKEIDETKRKEIEKNMKTDVDLSLLPIARIEFNRKIGKLEGMEEEERTKALTITKGMTKEQEIDVAKNRDVWAIRDMMKSGNLKPEDVDKHLLGNMNSLLPREIASHRMTKHDEIRQQLYPRATGVPPPNQGVPPPPPVAKPFEVKGSRTSAQDVANSMVGKTDAEIKSYAAGLKNPKEKTALEEAAKWFPTGNTDEKPVRPGSPTPPYRAAEEEATKIEGRSVKAKETQQDQETIRLGQISREVVQRLKAANPNIKINYKDVEAEARQILRDFNTTPAIPHFAF